jgi:hypothetical protein
MRWDEVTNSEVMIPNSKLRYAVNRLTSIAYFLTL